MHEMKGNRVLWMSSGTKGRGSYGNHWILNRLTIEACMSPLGEQCIISRINKCMFKWFLGGITLPGHDHGNVRGEQIENLESKEHQIGLKKEGHKDNF